LEESDPDSDVGDEDLPKYSCTSDVANGTERGGMLTLSLSLTLTLNLNLAVIKGMVIEWVNSVDKASVDRFSKFRYVSEYCTGSKVRITNLNFSSKPN